MAQEPARPLRQRQQDTRDRLDRDIDAWVASADQHGNTYLVPLSFLWDGAAFTIATAASSPTARNLRATGSVRLGVGLTRDVVLVDGTVESFTHETVPTGLADAFAAKLWDARDDEAPHDYFRITPQRIQAWREVNELPGRDVMRDGRWLD